MTKIVDLQGDSRIMGSMKPDRFVAGITKIARYHSATPKGDVWVFENHWRNLGWGTRAYHKVILHNGSVQLFYWDNVIKKWRRWIRLFSHWTDNRPKTDILLSKRTYNFNKKNRLKKSGCA